MKMTERLQQIIEEALKRRMVNLYKTIPAKGYTVYRVFLGGTIPMNIILKTNRKRASSQSEYEKDWTENREALCDTYLGLVQKQDIRYRFHVHQSEYAHRNIFTGKIEVRYETDGSSETFAVPEKWFNQCEDYVGRDNEEAKNRFKEAQKSLAKSMRPTFKNR